MRRALTCLAVLAVVASGCSDDAGDDAAPASAPSSTSTPVRPCTEDDSPCPLGVRATDAGVLLGTATASELLDDPAYRAVLATEFNSITAEREMKWGALQPERGVYDFGRADELVAFADDNDLAVKGHTLVWEQATIDDTPAWVEEIDDRDELWSVVEDHFETVLGHFGEDVDRWDVVNEPLETTGTAVYQNHFYRVLGPDYIDEMFRLADELAPETRLFLNEAAVEILPAKADAFYELVADMVERGVPLDGVGLQGHLFGGTPAPGVIEELITRFVDLGLEVAITELDIVAPEGADRLQAQADDYAQVVDECLAAGCREITVWGLDDGHTWLDSFLGRPDSDPLLFDEDLQPKPAYDAVHDALRAAQ